MTKHYSADEIAALFFNGKYDAHWITPKQAGWLLGQWRTENQRHSALPHGQVGADGQIFINGKFAGTWQMAISPRNGAGLLKAMLLPPPEEPQPAPSLDHWSDADLQKFVDGWDTMVAMIGDHPPVLAKMQEKLAHVQSEIARRSQEK